MWSFETDPDFQQQLDWIDRFVREQVEPLDELLGSQWNIHDPQFERLVRPLQALVKERGLWACHLGPELGGKGYGQLKLALMNEKFGQSRFGPVVFGCQAPDSGNAEILAHYGTPAQKKRFLEPLLENRIVSCFSMTEPQGGADPLVMTSTAEQDGDHWVLNGEKWFASNARYAAFHIFMMVTDPDAAPHRRMSMFIVPADTPGVDIVRNYGFYGEKEDSHGHIRLRDVRVPADSMLGGRGDAFVVAQVRLGGGRMHHAMRTLAQASRAFDMMCQRVVSRVTKGERLAEKQMVQETIADSWIELRQFRLLVLETAWLLDQGHDYKATRHHIAAVKVKMPQLLHTMAARALHLHGSLGITHDMPFAEWLINSHHVALADGPTEVHKVTVARQVLAGVEPCESLFPDYMADARQERARALYGD
ncbi:acyl-CoA dehydrogenase family protein [Alloalcanivorax mobilis]|uniref:acyl-CoA dehydrogenase family protein n=1 Tax=Alloalcanivorax mobilis TaxID=2019569 RepID=UPI000C7786DF|nr:acyl-CoA dehydrogenase family protein [Alloalcanivorax mobilis]